MGQYFDKSPILGGNAANGGYCYELGGVSGPDLTTVMSDKRNCSA